MVYRKLIHLLCFILIILLSFSGKTFSQTQQEAEEAHWIKLASPSEGTLVFEKKPLVKCFITLPFARENLAVILDKTDVTGIIDISKEGFEFKPIQVLSPGQHKLIVTLTTNGKKEFKKEYAFTIRHSRMLEEISSTNDVTVLYEGMTQRRIPEGETDSTPYSKVEGNISSASKIKEGAVEASFRTNVRYLDQSEPVDSPMFKGFNVADYLLSLQYRTEKTQFLAAAGDVQIYETQNTVALSRRGVNVKAGYGNFLLNTFSVKAQQVSGLRHFKDDSGLGFDPADKIEGTSGELNLFDKKVNLKAIYVRGQEPGTSYGSWFSGGGKKGDTTGFVFKTDFFSQKLKTEMEYDFANYDQDTSDTLPIPWDKAYRFKTGGQIGSYNYEGLYEFFGPQYSSIGNAGVSRDREGYRLNGGGRLDAHTVNVSFSRYNDNVLNSALLPTMYTYQGGVDYSFSKFTNFPMGLGYQTTLTVSDNEPEGTVPTDVRINNVTGRINYQKNPWNLGLNASYADQTDKHTGTNDNRNVTLAFTPAYASDRFSFTPSFSLNRVRYDYSNVVTDTYTANLVIGGNVLDRKVDYNIAYAFNKAMTSDNTTSNETTDINFRVGYLLAKQRFGLVNPTVGVKGNYKSSNDLLADKRSEYNYIFLFFSASAPISF